MNDAKFLRDAARALQERADNARGGRWIAQGTEVVARWRYDDRPVASTANGSPVKVGRLANALYIATVEPAIGKALAVWLREEAARADERDVYFFPFPAIEIAELILREDA